MRFYYCISACLIIRAEYKIWGLEVFFFFFLTTNTPEPTHLNHPPSSPSLLSPLFRLIMGARCLVERWGCRTQSFGFCLFALIIFSVFRKFFLPINVFLKGEFDIWMLPKRSLELSLTYKTWMDRLGSGTNPAALSLQSPTRGNSFCSKPTKWTFANSTLALMPWTFSSLLSRNKYTGFENEENQLSGWCVEKRKKN